MEKKWYLLLTALLFFFLSPVETRPSSGLDVALTPSIIGQGEVALLSIQKLGKAKPIVIWMGKRLPFSQITKIRLGQALSGLI